MWILLKGNVIKIFNMTTYTYSLYFSLLGCSMGNLCPVSRCLNESNPGMTNVPQIYPDPLVNSHCGDHVICNSPMDGHGVIRVNWRGDSVHHDYNSLGEKFSWVKSPNSNILLYHAIKFGTLLICLRITKGLSQ